MKQIPYIENLEQWRSHFKFNIPIKIRFSETDMFGHMNNVSPFIYFEEARIEFMKSVGLFGSEKQEEGIPVVADLQCDYHKQLYFDEQINLYVKANHVGRSSIDLHYMAINETGELCITGRGRIVYINSSTGKPVSLNDEMKERLRNH